jgi:replicative DNA helicase
MAAEFQLRPARWEGSMNAPFTTPIRTAPHNIEAEQALLGAILVNNEAFYRVSDFLEPKHFLEGIQQCIYEIAGDLIRAGKLATPVTLKTFLATDLDIAGLTVNQIFGPSRGRGDHETR